VPDGSGAVSKDSILAGIGDQLAKFKRPKEVLFLDALPRNTMGKVQKAAFRADYSDLFKG
jgi:malonyl-CoA/methylmalonyl-CoA synthetase